MRQFLEPYWVYYLHLQWYTAIVSMKYIIEQFTKYSNRRFVLYRVSWNFIYSKIHHNICNYHETSILWEVLSEDRCLFHVGDFIPSQGLIWRITLDYRGAGRYPSSSIARLHATTPDTRHAAVP